MSFACPELPLLKNAWKMIRTGIRARPRSLRKASGRGAGREGRAAKLTEMVSKLVRFERMESTYPRCDETRMYAEKLINLAIRNGPDDPYTASMLKYWLENRSLRNKIFNVLVPRFKDYKDTKYTRMYRLPMVYPGFTRPGNAVLELKGNPWPPIVPKEKDMRNLISNILLQELARELRSQGKNANIVSMRHTMELEEELFQPPEDESENINNENKNIKDNESGVDELTAKLSETEMSDQNTKGT